MGSNKSGFQLDGNDEDSNLYFTVRFIASKYLHQELDDTISADPGFSANRAIEVASETELRSPMTTHEFVGRIKRSPKKNKKKKNSSEEDDDESKEEKRNKKKDKSSEEDDDESEESNEEMSGDGTNDTEDSEEDD